MQALSGKIKILDKNGHKQVVDVDATSGNPVQVRAGQDVEISVSVLLPDSSQDGQYKGTLGLVTPDGNASVPLSVTLSSNAQLYVMTQGSSYLRLPVGDSVSVDYTFINNGAPTQVIANLTSAPNGVSLDGFSLQMSNGDVKTGTLVFRADPNAGWTTGDLASVDFSAFGQAQASSCSLGVDVLPAFYEWDWPGSAGKIDMHTSLLIQPSGDYEWTAHLHDNSTYYGDSYVLVVGLPYRNAAGGVDFHYLQADGSLGAKLSGPPVDADIHQTGNSPILRQNYLFAIETGWSGHLHVEGDPFGALPSILAAAEKYGPQIATLAGL